MSIVTANPEKMIESGLEYYNEYLKLLTNTNKKLMGQDVTPLFKADEKDKSGLNCP